jgi:hypothetical protein
MLAYKYQPGNLLVFFYRQILQASGGGLGKTREAGFVMD